MKELRRELKEIMDAVKRHIEIESLGGQEELIISKKTGGRIISSEDSLENLYRKYGLVRRWKAYSLKRKGKVTAVLIQNQSDPGLNLSELLNGIKILVLDSEKLPWDVLAIAIGKLALRYDGDKAPVLIYPFEYVEAKGIPYEKQYQMWILDVNHGNEYMEYMQNRFRIGRSE